MSSDPRVLRTLWVVLLLLLSASPAASARAERRDLVIQGYTLDRSGKPVSGARIQVSGYLETQTISGSDGAFAVTLHLGTAEMIRQRALKFVIDARSRGKSLRISGGPSKLELDVRGAAAGGGIEVVANVAEFGAAATRVLQVPKESRVPFDLTFTTGQGRVEAPRHLARQSTPPPPASSAPAAVVTDPAARAADSLLDFREPSPSSARTAGSAPSGEPVSAALKSAAGSAPPSSVAPPPEPPILAPSDSAAPPRPPVVSSPSTTAARPPAGDARATATPPASDARATVTPPARSNARDARRTNRQPPTALEMLEAARNRGTILASEADEDSLRALDRQLRNRPEEPRGGSRPAAPGASAEKARASGRDARLEEETSRYAMRRDSALAALRVRDSLAAVARAIARFNEQERQDSLRALKKPPRLDARIPVGARSSREEPSGDRQSEDQDQGCYCNVEGTIEVRSNRPLSAPFGVTVQVRGRPTLRDRVLMFMGSPREFVIGRVPCGTRYLDVLPEPGRPFRVGNKDALGPFDCDSGRLHQIRITLVPR